MISQKGQRWMNEEEVLDEAGSKNKGKDKEFMICFFCCKY